MPTDSVRPQAASPWLLPGCAALLSGLLFAHLDALKGMVWLWWVSPMYSYAVTVPFISGFLVWTCRDRLAALQPAGSWRSAAPVLAVGVLMLVAGRAGGVQLLQQLAFLVSVVGVIVALLGLRYVRVMWPALAYLLLMIPLWDGVTESLHAPFQQQSATLGTWIVRLFGVPAYRDGLVIELSNLTIQVARACSGVNYLVAVIALGLPLAYLFLRSPWRRLVLLAGAVAVAALSNAVRVALICTLAYYDIGSPLHGPFHVLHGLFVAGIGYLALFAGIRWLSAGERASEPAAPARPANQLRHLPLGAVGALALVFWALGAVPSAHEAQAVSLVGGLDALPLRLGDWQSRSAARPEGTLEFWPGADHRIRRLYRDPAGRVMEVYVAYFESQGQGREVASSWAAELHRTAVPVRIPRTAGAAFPANRVQLPGQGGREALFWYEIDGAIVAGRLDAIASTTWNALVRGRNNAAVVMIAEAEGWGSSDSTIESMASLATLVEQGLGAMLPGRPVMGTR